MAIHHKKLSAALAKYQPLIADNISKEDVVSAINEDTKGYNDEEIIEIIAALYPEQDLNENSGENEKLIIKEEKDSPGKKGYIVIEQFRDKKDYNTLYAVGTEINGFDNDRIEDLVKRGLIALHK